MYFVCCSLSCQTMFRVMSDWLYSLSVVFDCDVNAKVFILSEFFSATLCRGTSQGKYGSRTIDLVCVGETVGKIGEVDEIGERELVLVVSVRCGKE